ncbi:TetR/AcrR family transcriptional regulator [Nonomuraea sp. ATR24]|uniref:TetR/AcrR family transcriptional regulator n=1 Tax=Nonomuraea sp. ATR24 TaxID=1676744 RepID=UPI0035BF7F9D
MTSDDFVPPALRRLWRLPESSRLGRPAALDVDLVVAAAVEIADRDGLGGVTIPKVAKSLGFTGMSLYRYVGSKDELLTLMADAAAGPG